MRSCGVEGCDEPCVDRCTRCDEIRCAFHLHNVLPRGADRRGPIRVCFETTCPAQEEKRVKQERDELVLSVVVGIIFIVAFLWFGGAAFLYYLAQNELLPPMWNAWILTAVHSQDFFFCSSRRWSAGRAAVVWVTLRRCREVFERGWWWSW
jgi:hypothetical protein